MRVSLGSYTVQSWGLTKGRISFTTHHTKTISFLLFSYSYHKPYMLAGLHHNLSSVPHTCTSPVSKSNLWHAPSTVFLHMMSATEANLHSQFIQQRPINLSENPNAWALVPSKVTILFSYISNGIKIHYWTLSQPQLTSHLPKSLEVCKSIHLDLMFSWRKKQQCM